MNKIFPTLYSRDSIGNIRIWYMEQSENKHRAISGLLDGEKVTSEWTVTFEKNSGKKNSTTAIEQATKEIEAKYKKQKKTGYFEDVSDVDISKYVEPMLAKLYKNYSDEIKLEKKEWILQCKFNGVRCIATKDGLFTRKGEKYISCPHISKSLSSFFEEHPDAVLDGELFNNDLRQQLNEIAKLVRKTVHISKEDLELSEKLVKYYIYDGYGFGLDKDHPYHERKQWIDLNLVGKYVHVAKVEDYEINHENDLNNHYQYLVEDGHEGAILRKKNMKYEHKRSKNLLKLKPEDDDEAIIVDIQEGTGNWSGAGKIITLDWNGKKFDATFKGTLDQSINFLQNKKNWIGKKVTFLYNGLTGKGTPNFARVDINNCIKVDR
jgi:DNA ligase-1